MTVASCDEATRTWLQAIVGSKWGAVSTAVQWDCLLYRHTTMAIIVTKQPIMIHIHNNL